MSRSSVEVAAAKNTGGPAHSAHLAPALPCLPGVRASWAGGRRARVCARRQPPLSTQQLHSSGARPGTACTAPEPPEKVGEQEGGREEGRGKKRNTKEKAPRGLVSLGGDDVAFFIVLVPWLAIGEGQVAILDHVLEVEKWKPRMR